MTRHVEIIRGLVFTLIIWVTLVIQPTIIRGMSINQIAPNIAVITIITFGMLRGKTDGAIIGIALGLGQDIFFGSVVGFYGLIYFYIGYLSGFLYRKFYKESIMIPISVIAGADLVVNVYVFFFTFLFRGRINFGNYFIHIILPEIVYTMFIGIIIYKLYQVINDHVRRLETDKEAEL